MTERISVYQQLGMMAEVTAMRGTCSRLKVGALITRQGRMISSGYNGTPSGMPHCDHSSGEDVPCLDVVHAEANAIAFAARLGVASDNAHMICTHAPCLGCANLIINSGITTLSFLHYYKNTDGLTRLFDCGVQISQIN